MPLTIHAAWLRSDSPFPDGQLFLWAENPDMDVANGPVSAQPATSPAGKNQQGQSATDGRQRAHKVPSHPTQVSVGQLRLLVAELAPSGVDLGIQPANAVVWLPSQQGVPLARRSVLQRGFSGLDTDDRPPVTLAVWQVTGLVLPPLPTLAFLSHLSSHWPAETAAPGSALRQVRLGADLLFWSNAAKSVFEILSRQHYVPTLIPDVTGSFLALWQPFLRDAAARQQLNELVAAMPPLCRAYDLADPGEAPTSAELVEHFIATLVDATVRHWGGSMFRPGVDGLPTDRSGDRSSDLTGTHPAPALHWLERLLSPQRHLHLPPQPAHSFYQEWRSWTEPLYVQGDANFRICFQLESPSTPDGLAAGRAARPTWTLRYFLQARDNPHLVIPADQVWQARGSTLRVGSRRLEQPQERLLAGLGLASRLFAPIKESLRSPRPELALLSTEQAYQFLREIGPLLESSGFGVITPDWWRAQERTRLGLRLHLYSDDWTEHEHGGQTPQPHARRSAAAPNRAIRFRWELTLGDQTLDQAEFEQLAALHTPLVYLGGRWVILDPVQMAAARAFLDRNLAEGQMGLLETVRVVQSHLERKRAMPDDNVLPQDALAFDGREYEGELLAPGYAETLPLDTIEVSGWLETALAHIQGQQPIGEISEPAGFQGVLRPYQRRGVGWLWYLRCLGLGACLADDMGLGKTVETIALLLHQRNTTGQGNGNDALQPPALLICPTSVVANWWHELNRFAPQMRALIHHGSSRLSGDDFRAALQEHDLVITSYGTARRDVEMLREIGWGNLILDEAQNIKNPGAKQTQAVRQLPAHNRIVLTGTPVENRLLELWSIMEFLNPGYLGSREHFRQQYVLPIERYNDEQSTAELRRLVQPFLLRRLKTDPTIISDLPAKNEMIVYCPLTPEQAALYEAVVRETMARVEESQGIRRRGLVLGLLTRLKQVCNHPAHYLKEKAPLSGRSGKLNRLSEMLEEALSVGDRALVFTQFVEMGDLLQAYLSQALGAEVLFLHGGTPAARRDQMVQYFQQEEGGPAIFVLSLRAGGIGLNLTRASHVFHFDRWWNPAVENQATDRAFRIGQKRSVQVYKFVVAGTLEERIHELIESKQALAASIVGSGEEWLTELDNDQLRELLTLRREVIGEQVDWMGG